MKQTQPAETRGLGRPGTYLPTEPWKKILFVLSSALCRGFRFARWFVRSATRLSRKRGVKRALEKKRLGERGKREEREREGEEIRTFRSFSVSENLSSEKRKKKQIEKKKKKTEEPGGGGERKTRRKNAPPSGNTIKLLIYYIIFGRSEIPGSRRDWHFFYFFFFHLYIFTPKSERQYAVWTYLVHLCVYVCTRMCVAFTTIFHFSYFSLCSLLLLLLRFFLCLLFSFLLFTLAVVSCLLLLSFPVFFFFFFSLVFVRNTFLFPFSSSLRLFCIACIVS